MNSLKVFCIPSAVLCLCLLACDEKPKNPVAEYGDAMIDSYKRGQQAGEKADFEAVKKAVESYYASNGKYPDSLEATEEFIGSKIDISKYDYDPSTGRVSLKK